LSGAALEGDKNPVMSEELEDVIYYSCEVHEGFFFLTSEEHLMVFDPGNEDGRHITGDLDGYLFPGETMASPPEAGHVVAARYLVESEGRLAGCSWSRCSSLQSRGSRARCLSRSSRSSGTTEPLAGRAPPPPPPP
jgi:hypothetical protein